MMVRVLVDELGSRAALTAILSGLSPFALAFEISDNTAPSLMAIPAAWMISDLDLISSFMSFLLFVSLSARQLKLETDESSESRIAKLFGREMCLP